MSASIFTNACWLQLAMFCVIGCLAATALHAGDLPSLHEIRKRIAEQQSQFSNLYLEVRVRGTAKGGLKAVAALGKGEIPNVIETFAAKGDKRYRQTTYLADVETTAGIRPEVGATAPPEVRKTRRAEQEQFDRMVRARREAGLPANEIGTQKAGSGETVAFDGSEIRQLQGTWAQTATPKEKYAPGRFSCTYFKSIALYVPDPPSQPKCTIPPECLLPKVLDHSDGKLSAEAIEGDDCVRVETHYVASPPAVVRWAKGTESVSVHQTFWLSLRHSLMVRKVEVKSEKGLIRSINSKPREILPGFWLPMECRVEEWGETQAPERPPTMVTTLEVVKCRTDVDDSLFALTFPAGTRVVDTVLTEKQGRSPEQNPIIYEIPADRALLDQVIEQAIKNQPPSSRREFE